MAQFCANCGSRIQDGEAFCGNCGTPVMRESAVNAPDRQPSPQQQQHPQTPYHNWQQEYRQTTSAVPPQGVSYVPVNQTPLQKKARLPQNPKLNTAMHIILMLTCVLLLIFVFVNGISSIKEASNEPSVMDTFVEWDDAEVPLVDYVDPEQDPDREPVHEYYDWLYTLPTETADE